MERKEIIELQKFVKPFYENKDNMHNLFHINRILNLALKLSKNYKIDKQLMIYGAYLHGINHHNPKEVLQFLKSQKLRNNKIKQILNIAEESHKENKPKTIEGTLLHDAHLLEGGKTFIVVKTLLVGAERKRSLEDTIRFMEKNIFGKYKCYLPQAQKIFLKKEKYAREFVIELKKGLK